MKKIYLTEKQLNKILSNKRLLSESAVDRFIDRLIYEKLPDNVKPYFDSTVEELINTKPEVFNQIALTDNREVLERYKSLKLKDFIRISIMQLFDIHNGRGPVKYMRGIFRIVLDELNALQNPDMNSIQRLKDNVMYIMQSAENGDKETQQIDGNLNGLSMQEICSMFNEKRKSFMKSIRDRIGASVTKETQHKYKKITVLKHSDCIPYQPYEDWCISFDNSINYNSYVRVGNRFYIFLRDDYKKYSKYNPPVGSNCPFDDYGMSMVAIRVDVEGNIITITTRWNQEHDGDMNPPSEEDIKMVMNLMGVNLYSECPPYTREELHAMGVVLFDEVQDLLDSGKKPDEIFDDCCDFHEGYARVQLNGKWNFIDTNGKILRQNQWFEYCCDFSEGYAGVCLNDKWNFIDTNGKILRQNRWFDDCYDFHEGCARVKLNGKWNFISTNLNIFYTMEEAIADSKRNNTQINENKIKRNIYLTEKQISDIKKKLKSARDKTNTTPTEKQKECGNYANGKLNIFGFDIVLENPKGSYRSGVNNDGKKWKTLMHNDYGYFSHTQGKDGDEIDVFLGNKLDSEKIFVIDQKVGGKFDESKVMLGFTDEEDAKNAYLSNYELDWKGFWKITEVDIECFKEWLYDGYKQRKPFHEYAMNKNKGDKKQNNINESIGVDMSTVGGINYSWDFDKEEYEDWLKDSELENNNESFMEYINDNVEFEFEYVDNETYHYFDREFVSYDDIELEFGEKNAKYILNDCIKNGHGYIETSSLYEDEKYDINNPTELNQIAIKLLQHGEYYKNCRGFILTNGEIVYTPNEHNQCTIIDGVKGTFHFIRLGNIRLLPQSIDLSKKPTKEQREVLRQVIQTYSNDTLYLDIIPVNGGSEIGCQYTNPDWRYVMGEIDRYFDEGIKPLGKNNIYESKKQKLNENIIENYYDEYDIRYVLDDFINNPNGTQNWKPLINPTMYQKALQEFTQYGEFRNFPTKYIYQWIGIIVRNALILDANTELAGHCQYMGFYEMNEHTDFKNYVCQKLGFEDIEFDDDCTVICSIQYIINKLLEANNYNRNFLSKEELDIINGVQDNLLNEEAIHKSGPNKGQMTMFVSQPELDYYDYKQEIKMKNLTAQSIVDIYNYHFTEQENRANCSVSDCSAKVIDGGKIELTINIFTILDECGLYDWMEMPDGSDAWSDYGLSPLFEILNEYNENTTTPEQAIVIINKALDVSHQRGDLSGIFIEGGRKSLSTITYGGSLNRN